MTKTLTLADIEDNIQPKIYTQNYNFDTHIEGVKIIKLTNHIGEEGDFSEIMKLNSTGEVKEVPGFKLEQINRTKLSPKSVKAWHLHFKQDEIWYIAPPYHVFVGLWDVRKSAKTVGKTMRIGLGGGESRLLYIPRGVAHGSANFSYEPVQLYYFTNEAFDPDNPDEKRINWDALGPEFWQPARD